MAAATAGDASSPVYLPLAPAVAVLCVLAALREKAVHPSMAVFPPPYLTPAPASLPCPSEDPVAYPTFQAVAVPQFTTGDAGAS